MAVAVNQRFARHGAERQLQAAGLRLANQKFLEQQSMRADALGFVVRTQREQFVAKRQETARLQPDDRHAARGEWRVGRDQPVQFAARLFDQAGGEECPPATQRTGAVDRSWNMHAISAFNQHTQRGVEILALVGAVEGIGEQHDLMAIRGPENLSVGLEHVAAERGQSALRADAGKFLEQRCATADCCCASWRAGRSARPGPHSAADSRPAGRAAKGRVSPRARPAPRSSSWPCRRRSGIHGGRPCRIRRVSACPSFHPRPVHPAPTGRKSPAAACWRGLA